MCKLSLTLPLVKALAVCGIVVAALSSPMLAFATIIFSDDFEAETPTMSVANYTGFVHWNVIQGAVDLIVTPHPEVKCFNDVGKCVDMDGDSPSAGAGTLESKTTFVLSPGMYEISLLVSGSQRSPSPVDTMTVSLGSVFSQTVTLNFDAPYRLITMSFPVAASDSGTLRLAHEGADIRGLMLDGVTLAMTSAGVGGDVAGVRPTKVICKNVTTGRKVIIRDGASAWNCEAAGLVVHPGDVIQQTIKGVAD